MTEQKLKITWTEKTLSPGDKFKHKGTGEILIFNDLSDSPFQREVKMVFTEVSTTNTVAHDYNDVERLD